MAIEGCGTAMTCALGRKAVRREVFVKRQGLEYTAATNWRWQRINSPVEQGSRQSYE